MPLLLLKFAPGWGTANVILVAQPRNFRHGTSLYSQALKLLPKKK
jgi:hypothetical protein